MGNQKSQLKPLTEEQLAGIARVERGQVTNAKQLDSNTIQFDGVTIESTVFARLFGSAKAVQTCKSIKFMKVGYGSHQNTLSIQIEQIQPKNGKDLPLISDIKINETMHVIIEDDNNTLSVVHKVVHKVGKVNNRYTIKLGSTNQDEEQKARKIKDLLGWNEVFNKDRDTGVVGAQIYTRERLNCQIEAFQAKEAARQEYSLREIAEKQRIAAEKAAAEKAAAEALVDDAEPVAAQPAEKTDAEIEAELAEAARLAEEARKKRALKKAKAQFEANLRSRGIYVDNVAGQRRLAANEPMENDFTLFWALPLLVIFVFWFKRYIVTRKNNDDNDIVEDNVNGDENDLNNIV